VIKFCALLFKTNSSAWKASKKKKDSQGRCGGQDHFVGFKLQFLELRALEYQQSLNISNPGPFYNKVSLDSSRNLAKMMILRRTQVKTPIALGTFQVIQRM
jgi:hypothetical protein